MTWRDHISLDPDVLVGKPVVKGTRIAVEFVLDLLVSGWSFDEILQNYPGLTADHIRACIAYAKDAVSDERVYPGATA
jgi:uncharacterized protein (DUF433 family)